MRLWERIGSVLLGALLLVSAGGTLPGFRATQQWLILLAVPLGLAGMWGLARHEKLTFGAWGDYVWGSLVGVLFLLVTHALVTGADLGEAIGRGFSMGAFIGLGLALLLSGLRGRFSPPPSSHSNTSSGAAAYHA